MLFLLKEILKGKSFVRALFNRELRNYKIKGRVLDIGGGKHQDYLEIIKKEENIFLETVDIVFKNGTGTIVDFEKDNLPFGDLIFDQVLVFNVLEHIYNYNFLITQVNRVLKKKGTLFGFTPFLVNYHPDPNDYFRFTKEALRKILEDNNFKNINIIEIGRGPFAVNFNNILLSLPIIARIIIFPFFYFMDYVFITFRPKIRQRYPLGYIFVCIK